MRKFLILACFAAAQPVHAATSQFEFSMGFMDEFFQDVVDFDTGASLPSVANGAAYGFEGRFSGMAPGEAVRARLSISDDNGLLTVDDCEFGTFDCTGGAEMSDDGQSVSVYGAAGAWLLSFDLEEERAVFFEDDGNMTDAGMFRSYGANFSLGDATSPVIAPLPLSAGLLLTGLAFLGLRRRRN